MSYEDWTDEFQDLFDTVPGLADAELNDREFDIRIAEALFEEGFTRHADEYDASGLDPAQVSAIRAEFFDYIGLNDADFDWAEWREAMGYELWKII